jgi:hypothetical protein
MNRFVFVSRASLRYAAVGVLAAGCSRPAPELTSTTSAVAAPTTSASVAADAVDAGPPTPSPFEGEILVMVNDPTNALPQSVTYDVKGSKVLYIARGTSLRAIADLDMQRVYAIDDTVQTYDLMYFKAPAKEKPAAKDKPPPTVEKTGRMEKVADLDCEDWEIDDGHEKVDVCAASGIAYFDFAADARSGHPEVAWATALTAEKAFPLRAVVHDEFGKGIYRADATKATRMRINDAMFLMPRGFKSGELASETKHASLP